MSMQHCTLQIVAAVASGHVRPWLDQVALVGGLDCCITKRSGVPAELSGTLAIFHLVQYMSMLSQIRQCSRLPAELGLCPKNELRAGLEAKRKGSIGTAL